MPGSSRILTSDELRSRLLATSIRRGAPVARRRLVLRWSGWLLWRFFLPMIGLTTLLAGLLVFASMKSLGSAKVLETAHTWLVKHVDAPRIIEVLVCFDGIASGRSTGNPSNHGEPASVIPQLQIDRNYSSHDQTNTATLPAASQPSSSPLSSGAQP